MRLMCKINTRNVRTEHIRRLIITPTQSITYSYITNLWQIWTIMKKNTSKTLKGLHKNITLPDTMQFQSIIKESPARESSLPAEEE